MSVLLPDPLIWCLLDERVGNQNQCLGVASALNLPFTKVIIHYNHFGSLPNILLGSTFISLTQKSKNNLKKPWPNILIAAGRRTSPIAQAIKRKSNNKTKLIQIMDPGFPRKSFDLLAIPSHDISRKGNNILTILGAPHQVTPERLQNAAQEWDSHFSELPRPWVGLLLGGSTRRREFTNDMAVELGKAISEAMQNVGGSVLVTTSPRSGSLSNIVIDNLAVPHIVYQFDNNQNNPYMGILGLSDYLVVTGESVSMCSEACATKAPVYIYAPKKLITQKHRLLHEKLIQKGYARLLGAHFERWSHHPLNSSNIIADQIKKHFIQIQNG